MVHDKEAGATINVPPPADRSVGNSKKPLESASATPRLVRRSTRLRRWLISDKTPFLFAILLAALAWCVTRVADRAVALPIIEYGQYSLSRLPKSIGNYRFCESSKGTHAYAYSVRNISKQVAFTNLGLYFYASPGHPITETRWADRPPGLAEPLMPQCSPQDTTHRGTLTLGQLQPGWNGIAMVWTTDTKAPLLIYRLASPGASSTDPRAVYLVEANMTTWIIRHEFELYYATIGLLMALILWYGGIYARRD